MTEKAIDAMPAPAAPRGQVLTVVIPALDEEEAIGSTIRRCLEAEPEICDVAGLDGIEIIVVSDGSTDRTVEIARSFVGVQVVVFEKNRGYGAAIKEGFRRGSGTLLGFLDADGTCDPRYFGPMCRRVIVAGTDVVLGSRLGPDSKMPRTRRLGNRIFALLLSGLCGRRVTDTASGMRVIRRSALAHLYPLPDGLHFTPSMSARALLNDLDVVEIPMRYEERIGTSKLSVGSDGVRFLRTIFAGVLCYQPERLFLIGFALCLIAGLALAAQPIAYYLHSVRVEDWMIYRFLVCFMLGATGFQLLGGAAIAHRMAKFGPRRRPTRKSWSGVTARMFEGRPLFVFTAAISLVSLILLWPGLIEYATTLAVNLHWSRVVTGVFGFVVVGQALVTGVLLQVLDLWNLQRSAQRDSGTDAPPRLRFRPAPIVDTSLRRTGS